MQGRLKRLRGRFKFVKQIKLTILTRVSFFVILRNWRSNGHISHFLRRSFPKFLHRVQFNRFWFNSSSNKFLNSRCTCFYRDSQTALQLFFEFFVINFKFTKIWDINGPHTFQFEVSKGHIHFSNYDFFLITFTLIITLAP